MNGRNDTLFRHLCSVQTSYSSIDLNSIAEFINAIVFTESLDNKELERTVESAKSYNNFEEYENTKDIIAFAQWLIPTLDIKVYNSDLFFLDSNRYITDDKLLMKKITEFSKLRKAQDNELIYQINKFAEDIKASLKELPILLKNGLIIDGEFSKINEVPFTPFYLDIEYNPNVYDENVDKFLNDITCNHKELRKTLEEILGHILLTNKFPAHVFFLAGGGNNGKSTFLEMINNFVGDLGQNLSLDAFNDGTSVSTLNGKLVNCSDETDDIFIDKCKGYKSLASGNTITVRPIYSQPVKVQNTATLILSANKMPEFKDKSQGFFRRLMIVPFDFVVKDKKENMDYLLSTDNAKSYILNLALKGVQSIKSNGYKMSKNQYLDEKIEEYKLDTDTVRSFLEEEPQIENRQTKEVHKEYCLYCCDIGKMSLGLSNFSSRLKEFGYYSTPIANPDKNSKTKTIRVYKRKEQ
ncbi:MAG: phage/plasmid primase, P4 family [Clostridia bacterium]